MHVGVAEAIGSGFFPDPRNFPPAIGAFAVFEGNLRDAVAEPLYHALPAIGANGIFCRMTGDVSDVDVMKAFFEGDFPGLFESGYGSWFETLELIEGEEPGKMEWDIRSEFAGDPFRHAPDLFGVVILAGYDQVYYLRVDSMSFQAREGIEHRLQSTPGHFPVVLVREALQIDARSIQAFAQIIERFGVNIPVRMHHIEKLLFVRQFADLQHVLHKNGRFHIGRGNGAATILRGFFDHLFRGKIIVERIFRGRLGDLPVLAELAIEIASGGSNGERLAGREQVEKRFFFDGVDMNGARISVDEGIIFSILVFPNAAISALAVCHFALAGAKFATDALFGKCGKIGREFSPRQPFFYFLCIDVGCEQTGRKETGAA
jgi:hypothetical protein